VNGISSGGAKVMLIFEQAEFCRDARNRIESRGENNREAFAKSSCTQKAKTKRAKQT
jgi:hypothetical protein